MKQSVTRLVARLRDRRSWTESGTTRRFLSARVSAREARTLLRDQRARRELETLLVCWGGDTELEGGLVLYIDGNEDSAPAFLQVCVAPGGRPAWNGPSAALRLVEPADPVTVHLFSRRR